MSAEPTKKRKSKVKTQAVVDFMNDENTLLYERVKDECSYENAQIALSRAFNDQIFIEPDLVKRVSLLLATHATLQFDANYVLFHIVDALFALKEKGKW